MTQTNTGVNWEAIREVHKPQLKIVIPASLHKVTEEQKAIQQDATAKREEQQTLVDKGKEIAKQVIPANAKALIIAVHDNDDSDLQSDYHGHTTLATIVLATSKHTRDLFPEMRKHADKIDETAHLAIKSTIDKSGEEKTDANKDWWHPADEHREKYSMGGGYYLKAGYRHDTGWTIKKQVKYGDSWSESVYIGLAQRLVLS